MNWASGFWTLITVALRVWGQRERESVDLAVRSLFVGTVNADVDRSQRA